MTIPNMLLTNGAYRLLCMVSLAGIAKKMDLKKYPVTPATLKFNSKVNNIMWYKQPINRSQMSFASWLAINIT
jgi:hypothetical protein